MGKINTFFHLNTITDEKLKIIENCSGINLNMYRKEAKQKKKLFQK